jgi:hypothetical protein
LEALDLSGVPEYVNFPSVINDSLDSMSASWLAYVASLEAAAQEPRSLTIEDLALFTHIRNDGMEHTEVWNNMRGLTERSPPSGTSDLEPSENVIERCCWRLFEREEEHEARTGQTRSSQLHELEISISESRLLKRLKWLGMRDWRVNPISKHARQLARQCTSLETLSIRGNYDRDHYPHEFSSLHDHVCGFVGGVVDIIPDTVRTVELRLSIEFVKQFLAILHAKRPSIEKVGIDLGAWIQVYPLRNEQEQLKDVDIRNRAIAVARQTGLHTYRNAHEGGSSEENMRNFFGVQANVQSDDYRNDQIYRRKHPNFYHNISGTVVRVNQIFAQNTSESSSSSIFASASDGHPSVQKHDFFSNHSHKEGGLECSLDRHTHVTTTEHLEKQRVDTLLRMLQRLKNDVDEHKGIRLFALNPEPEERSTDPIHPLVLLQESSNTELKSGSYPTDLTNVNAPDIYKWLELTFKWRPLFDWDW